MTRGFDQVRIQAVAASVTPMSVLIGRARTAQKTSDGSTVLTIHGLPVFSINTKEKVVTLDTCGHWTASVTRAQSDYCKAFGLDVKPSLTRGMFRAKFRGAEYRAGMDHKIRIKY